MPNRDEIGVKEHSKVDAKFGDGSHRGANRKSNFNASEKPNWKSNLAGTRPAFGTNKCVPAKFGI